MPSEILLSSAPLPATVAKDQFEFLRNRWMSKRSSPRNPAGDDLLIGLNDNVGRDRRPGVFEAKAEFVPLPSDQQWIRHRLFLSPSLSALRIALAGCG